MCGEGAVSQSVSQSDSLFVYFAGFVSVLDVPYRSGRYLVELSRFFFFFFEPFQVCWGDSSCLDVDTLWALSALSSHFSQSSPYQYLLGLWVFHAKKHFLFRFFPLFTWIRGPLPLASR